jgi:hypothetical protein
MKKLILVITALGFISVSACKVKKGCPSNGANVGAEKLLSGDPKALKDIKKGKKWKQNKY